MRKKKDRVIKSVHDVSATKPFEVLLNIFSAQPQRHSKGIVISYELRSPVARIYQNGLAAQESLHSQRLGFFVERFAIKGLRKRPYQGWCTSSSSPTISCRTDVMPLYSSFKHTRCPLWVRNSWCKLAAICVVCRRTSESLYLRTKSFMYVRCNTCVFCSRMLKRTPKCPLSSPLSKPWKPWAATQWSV